MKICMFSTSCILNNPTGGERRFLELFNSLKKNNNVTLYSCDSEVEAKNNNINNFVNIKKTKNKGVSFNVYKNNKKTLKEIKKSKYDLVVVFDITTAIILAVKNIKNIILFFRQDTIGYKKIIYKDKGYSSIKTKVLLKILSISEMFCIRRAKKICVQCEYDLNELIKRHKRYSKTIIKKNFIQINNVNPSWLKEINKKTNIKKEYDVVFIGNFRDSRKGHDLLLKTLNNLYNDGIKYKTAIIGDGKELEMYKNLYKDNDNIVFLGRLNNPLPILNKSRLMVVPSFADSCPNTVMEALFYEVPVVGAKTGGIPEILNNDDWLFNLDEKSLREKITSVLNNSNDNIINNQKERKKELTFNWGEKIEKKIMI